nr:filamentous hemagglutinin N-terminal domain-containing protein [Proteus mirabilis]
MIVANPSGIICNGCGTINAGRMTLTTGNPNLIKTVALQDIK